jgi:hypothetical protein
MEEDPLKYDHPRNLPRCDESAVYPILRDNIQHSYRFDPASPSSAASHQSFHAQLLSGTAVGILWKRIRSLTIIRETFLDAMSRPFTQFYVTTFNIPSRRAVKKQATDSVEL